MEERKMNVGEEMVGWERKGREGRERKGGEVIEGWRERRGEGSLGEEMSV